MSRYSFNIPNYDSALFGYPYQTGEPQITQPFWQQYPTWSQPDQSKDHYPIHPGNNYYRYNMDTQPLVIGYNTKNGRKLSEGGNHLVIGANSGDKPRPKGKVEVYINGVFIQTVPLGLLVRFSTTAQEAFPKPGKNAEDKGKKDHKGSNWAEDVEQKIDVGNLTADMAKLKQPSEVGDFTLAVSKSPCFEPHLTHNHNPNRRLDVYLGALWTQPPPEAFKFAFDWMFEARRTSNGEALLAYGVPDPDKLPLSKLVDLYAASLCLGLRPPANKLRSDLFVRLTLNPPSIEDVRYIHEHLPVDGRVTTRMITSFLQNRGASSHFYTKAQRDEIEAYFYEIDDSLYYRFQGIVDYRETQRRARLREKGADKLQKLAEGLQMGEETVTGDGGSTTTPKVGKIDGRRRDRRKQEKGKGVDENARVSV